MYFKARAFSVGPQPKPWINGLDYHDEVCTRVVKNEKGEFENVQYTKRLWHPRPSRMINHPVPVARQSSNGHKLRAQRGGKRVRVTTAPVPER